MPFFYRGVQIDHPDVITKRVHHYLAADPGGEGCEGCKHGSFRHFEGGEEFQISDEDLIAKGCQVREDCFRGSVVLLYL